MSSAEHRIIDPKKCLLLYDAPQGLFYNQNFEPEFTVGLFLRYFGIAQNLKEEISKSKEWNIYLKSADTETLINNSQDAKKYLKENCTLLIREKVNLGKREKPVEVREDQPPVNKV